MFFSEVVSQSIIRKMGEHVRDSVMIVMNPLCCLQIKLNSMSSSSTGMPLFPFFPSVHVCAWMHFGGRWDKLGERGHLRDEAQCVKSCACCGYAPGAKPRDLMHNGHERGDQCFFLCVLSSQLSHSCSVWVWSECQAWHLTRHHVMNMKSSVNIHIQAHTLTQAYRPIHTHLLFYVCACFCFSLSSIF